MSGTNNGNGPRPGSLGASGPAGAGIIVGSVWNFAVTTTFIWLRPEGR